MLKELEYPFNGLEILKNKKSLKRALLQSDNFITKKIAILSGYTVGEFQNILELFLLNCGIKPVFWQGKYNRFYEEAIFEIEDLKAFDPDIVYIHTTVKNLKHLPEITDNEETVNDKLNQEYEYFNNVWNNLKEKLNCFIIQNNFESLPYRCMGNSEVYHSNGELNFINLLNQKLYEYARNNDGFYINDLNYQSAWFGLEKWFDNTSWYLYKYPFSTGAIPLVSHNIANIIKSAYGKNKKALILDLDNTLWGGVIGDDGLANVKLGAETGEGAAYYDWQKYIKKLSNFGISLNVCSKNEESLAKLGFTHPCSLLKEDDFIVFKANWKNKDTNIKEILKELNVLDESAVLVDDNPAERLIVNQSIPKISTPNISSPEDYVKYLDQAGFFEVTTLSFDDKKRNEYYKANKKREAYAKSYTDYNEYLKSLEMICFFEQINENNIERAVQLINKTNQFNMTTVRYTESNMKEFLEDKSIITICSKLKDKFGDNGIVSCLIAKIHQGIAIIDLWVMSCRVFKRNLENAIIDKLVSICQQKNIKRIQGKYVPSYKNNYVSNLYFSLGFKNLEKTEKYELWEYTIPDNYIKTNTVMEEINND